MIRRLTLVSALLAAFAVGFSAAPASATLVQVDPNQNAVTLGAGSAIVGKVQVDQTTPGTTNGVVATGNVAAAAADSGNPLKIGCVYNSTLSSTSTGNRTNCQSDPFGAMRVFVTGVGASGADGLSNANLLNFTDNGTAAAFRMLGIAPFNFNGSSWDRQFTCTSSATVNVTAGSTTQIVGLSGSTVIRVCSIAISMSAAGTAGVYTGTGANCVTGSTAVIQDMTLATGMPLTLSAPAGGSIVRSSAGGELCVKAVTGNVTGVITYAQF